MTVMPALFVSHGSPMTMVKPSPAHDFLGGLGEMLPRPQAVVVISGHWCTGSPKVSKAAQPKTIHDFYGFPKALYELTYPAPGSPPLAAEIQALTGAKVEDRGLDHGAWVPLLMGWPDADIPVVSLSVQPQAGPLHHWRLGQALRPLREQGVLILASGALTHNLRAYFGDDQGSEARTLAFSDWMAAAVEEGRVDDLLAYREKAPEAVFSHPTDEHLLPLFVALGSGGQGKVLHRSLDGSLAMDAYAWA